MDSAGNALSFETLKETRAKDIVEAGASENEAEVALYFNGTAELLPHDCLRIDQ